MADQNTIDNLKASMASLESQMSDIEAKVQDARIKEAQAQAALEAYKSPVNLLTKINAQKALAADPTNVQLQQSVADIQSQWDASIAISGPLLAARDAAAAATSEALRPKIELENKINNIDLEIVKIDPSQASPEAVAYAKEFGLLPITSDAGVVVTPVSQVTSSQAAVFANEDPGVLTTPDGTIEGEGDAGTGLQEPPVPEEEDGAAEGGNTVGNAANVNFDGAAEGGNTVGVAANIDPNDDPAVRALMESSRQEAEDNFEFSDAPNTDDFDPPPPQKETPPPPAAKDWRVRISLAQSAKYFYASDTPGILRPLASTGGVVFPYTPSIAVAYNAKYDPTSITHSNYNMYNYSGSSVDQISITGDFTAQDTTEAAYMLAVIHFFRSATKMFYGQDENPKRGTPPPLLYLSGHGNYQFDNHPMVLTNFTYTLPTDVDYINAYPNGSAALNTVELTQYNRPNTAKPSPMQRLIGSGLQPGGMCKKPIFLNSPSGAAVVTRVPTRISITLNFLPVVTRNAITNKFSLREYANGNLLRGSQNPGTGGGIW